MHPSSDSFLSGLGLKDLAPLFAAKNLDVEAILKLTDEDLLALGVEKPGDRARLLAAARSADEGLTTSGPAGWKTTTNPDAATKDMPFVNCFGMLFVPIRRFKTLVSICPVRVCDFESFCEKKHRPMPVCDYAQGPDHPVVNVTWHEAKRFCEWVTEREQTRGLIHSSLVYRLPTDPEWSSAVGLMEEPESTPRVRSGKAPGYPWGSKFPPPRGIGNYHPRLNTDDFPETSPVAEFPPNRYGIYDLGGNAWEWCMDPYDPESEDRVLRGASCFNDTEQLLRSSYRDKLGPSKTRNNIGFRVVLSKSPFKDATEAQRNSRWT